MQKTTLMLWLGLLLCPTLAFGQTASCDMAPDPPVGVVELRAGSLVPVEVTVRLTNTGTAGLILDSVEIRATGGGPDGCSGCLNDGMLFTTHNASGGDPVPVGASYNFKLVFHASGVPCIDTMTWCGDIVAYVHSVVPLQQAQCFFNICANLGPWLPSNCQTRSDVDRNGSLAAGDVTLLLNFVIFGTGCCWCGQYDGIIGDLNCDGFFDIADVVLQLATVYLSYCEDPCPPPNVRPTVADTRDSIIMEERVIYPPGSGAPYTSLRVWITNKDPLSGVSLPLSEVTAEGPGFTFAVLPAGGGKVTNLSPTLGSGFSNFSPTFYTGASPSSFFVAGYGDPEPANAARKAIWDINFDDVLPPCGTIWFDSLTVPGGILDHTIFFVDANYRRVPVNFSKGRLALKGDVDGNGDLTPADVVLLLQCTFLGIGVCSFCDADINSDGGLAPADVVLELNGVFLGAFAP